MQKYHWIEESITQKIASSLKTNRLIHKNCTCNPSSWGCLNLKWWLAWCDLHPNDIALPRAWPSTMARDERWMTGLYWRKEFRFPVIMHGGHEAVRNMLHGSLEILSIQRVREFSILILDCIDSQESALPFPRSILWLSLSPSLSPRVPGKRGRRNRNQ